MYFDIPWKMLIVVDSIWMCHSGINSTCNTHWIPTYLCVIHVHVSWRYNWSRLSSAPRTPHSIPSDNSMSAPSYWVLALSLFTELNIIIVDLTIMSHYRPIEYFEFDEHKIHIFMQAANTTIVNAILTVSIPVWYAWLGNKGPPYMGLRAFDRCIVVALLHDCCLYTSNRMPCILPQPCSRPILILKTSRCKE